MARLRIQGGTPLAGDIHVQGSKNAALPIIAATLLTAEECLLHNVPRLRDIENLLELMASLGVTWEWIGDHDLRIAATHLSIEGMDQQRIAKLRGSVLLMGPLLARLRHMTIAEPGGDRIGNRPLDAHFHAFRKLGATVERQNGHYILSAPNGLIGAAFILPELSVTATENAVMAATGASGETRIGLAAAEPHVEAHIRFLRAMGANISGEGTHDLIIRGGASLHGVEYTIPPDQIEAMTWAVAAAVTRGEVAIHGAHVRDIELPLYHLESIGAHVGRDNGVIIVRAHGPLQAFRVKALPHPGFPTDLQAPFSVLATQCVGTSLMHDPLYDGRFGHVQELMKMGANAVICDPHRALISGPTPLRGTEVRSLDIRAGATLVLAGLIAEGETILHDAEMLDRGYERLVERLQGLGAKLIREE